MAAGSSTPILDTFDRANEGPPPSASWTNLNAGLKVVSNVCAANASNSVSYWNVSTPGPNCEVGCTITTKPANGQSIGVYLRGKDTGSVLTFDAYLFMALAQAGTDILRCQRIDNAVATTLGSDVSQEYAAGDKINLKAIGSTLIMQYFNGTSWATVGARSDTTYGAAGRLVAAIGDTTGRFDDFFGGTLQPRDMIISGDFMIPVLRG